MSEWGTLVEAAEYLHNESDLPKDSTERYCDAIAWALIELAKPTTKAAPALLDALEMISARAAEYRSKREGLDPYVESITEIARTAIARARLG